ncbi:MAG: Hsp20/alpha crystallin family protein [Anaerolineales bacterium]
MNTTVALECGPRWALRRRDWRWAEDEDVAYMPIPVDLREGAEEYILTTSLVGAKPEDISVRIEDDTLSLRAEVHPGQAEPDEFLMHERYVGKVGRTIRLPIAVDAENAQATLEAGLLTLRIPKAASARSKTIKVSVKA